MSGNKTFSIYIEGYGEETFAGKVPTPTAEYFEDKAIDLVEYDRGEIEDIPEEFDFAEDGLCSVDDVWHFYGPHLEEDNTITVTDDSGTAVWSSSLGIDDLEEAGVSLKVIKGAEDLDKNVDAITSSDNFTLLICRNIEEGILFENKLTMDEDFDPSKLTIYYYESVDNLMATAFEYNGVEIEPGSSDTTTEGHEYYFLF